MHFRYVGFAGMLVIQRCKVRVRGPILDHGFEHSVHNPIIVADHWPKVIMMILANSHAGSTGSIHVRTPFWFACHHRVRGFISDIEQTKNSDCTLKLCLCRVEGALVLL